jgi:hypothetical protein
MSAAIPQPFSKGSAMIWIDAYWRIRFGRVEHVIGHFRSLPQT